MGQGGKGGKSGKGDKGGKSGKSGKGGKGKQDKSQGKGQKKISSASVSVCWSSIVCCGVVVFLYLKTGG